MAGGGDIGSDQDETFFVSWGGFQQNIKLSLSDLVEEEQFTDVTLVCEGDKQISAHKVILSAASPFFKQILIKNPHQNPLIYLKGVNYFDLISVISFVYQGEAKIKIGDFDSFWNLAEELEIKGLNAIFFQSVSPSMLDENIKQTHLELQSKEKLMETDIDNEYESFLNTLMMKGDKEDIEHKDNDDDVKTVPMEEKQQIENELHKFKRSISTASMKGIFCRSKTKDRMKKVNSANFFDEADLSESFKYEPCQNGVHSRYSEDPNNTTTNFICKKCLTKCKTLENLHRHRELLDHY